MRMIALALATLCVAALPAAAQEPPTARADFVDTDGETVGNASLTGGEDGVLLEIEVSGLPAEGWVAFHVHETGECNPDDGFESAGGHFNPTDREHGYQAAGGPHAGDMPNQYVGTDDVMQAHVFNPFVMLGEGEADIAGRALVIHGGQDDYSSQPSGDAGDRLACAVIE